MEEYWSGLSCPPPGVLPNPGIEPRCPTLQANSDLPSEQPGRFFVLELDDSLFNVVFLISTAF